MELMATERERWVLFAAPGGRAASEQAREVLSGRSHEVWRPSWDDLVPTGLPRRFALWSLMQFGGVFASRRLEIHSLLSPAGYVYHRTCVLPAWYRWPFMAQQDLMISAVFTDERFRRGGLASAMAEFVVAGSPVESTVWWAARKTNTPALHVAKHAGFRPVGPARRTHMMGSRLLGRLQPLPAQTESAGPSAP